MSIIKSHNHFIRSLQAQRYVGLLLIISMLVGGTVLGAPLTIAESLQEQINDLSEQNAQHQGNVNELQEEAATLEEKLARLQAKIHSLQLQIDDNKAKIADLEEQIKITEAELEKQKGLLGENIRAMYLEGQITTLEMLASSQDLSEFVDKQQYRNSVKSKIVATLDKINDLKHELQAKQDEVESRLEDLERLQGELASERAENKQLLGLNQGEQNKLDKEIRKNNARIIELKRQQAIENMRLFGGSGGVLGGGGYPWGKAKCIHTGKVSGPCWNYDWAVGGSIWNWQTGGYGYRNCTDWVSFRVRSTGRFVPSGLGNAKNWVGNARSYGYKVSRTPKKGAAAVSTGGYYGHVMYVEAKNADGSIIVSDYNRAGTGKYDMNTLSAATASNLWYVYF